MAAVVEMVCMGVDLKMVRQDASGDSACAGVLVRGTGLRVICACCRAQFTSKGFAPTLAAWMC